MLAHLSWIREVEMLSNSFLHEKLFFIAESFRFGVIAMVCLWANHEWSQYLNSIGIGVLKFSLFLYHSRFLSQGFAHMVKSPQGMLSLNSLSAHFPMCLHCCCVCSCTCSQLPALHPALWLALPSWHCMIIVLLRNYVISFYDTAVNCQVRSAVLKVDSLRDVIASYILFYLLGCCSANWPVMYDHQSALHITYHS